MDDDNSKVLITGKHIDIVRQRELLSQLKTRNENKIDQMHFYALAQWFSYLQ